MMLTLRGELSGGKASYGSENKIRFVAAVEFNEKSRPIRMRKCRVSGFTTRGISSWTQNHVAAGTTVITDGLACFAGVTEAGCKHITKIAGGRKPKELPLFQWLNEVGDDLLGHRLIEDGRDGKILAIHSANNSVNVSSHVCFRFHF